MDGSVSTAASVLVVDDFPSTAELLALVLRREGFDAIAAESGEAALRAFHSHHFDLVISDLFLPGMSGFDLLRLLRAQRAIPAISISGNMLGRAKSRAVGFDDHLNKPVSTSEFLDTVRQVLRSKPGPSGDPPKESAPT